MDLPKSVFSMPTPMTITGRISSVTNAFPSSILPVSRPTDVEFREAFHLRRVCVDIG